MKEAENILEVRHLKQYFGKTDFKAVDDISFTVKKGEVVGIVGESGCGKTTTGRSIIRLNNATSGDVYFTSFPVRVPAAPHLPARQKYPVSWEPPAPESTGYGCNR